MLDLVALSFLLVFIFLCFIIWGRGRRVGYFWLGLGEWKKREKLNVIRIKVLILFSKLSISCAVMLV